MPIAALLLLIMAAEEPPITVKGYPWAPFVSPMGEPFRGGAADEAPIARWFGKADLNRDGKLSAEEMLADADRFFARLDANRDGGIDPPELTAYEWEIAPEIQVNSDWRRARGQAAAKPALDGGAKRSDEHDGYQVDGLQGAARYGLLNIPQPVASADADFNRLITREEFRLAATHRFRLLDSKGLGQISLTELATRLPIRPEGKRGKRDKDARDERIGLPLPEAD